MDTYSRPSTAAAPRRPRGASSDARPRYSSGESAINLANGAVQNSVRSDAESLDLGIAARTRPADSPSIDRPKQLERVDRWVEWAERVLPSVWADPVSRWCLLGAVAFFWLTVTLGAPVLVLPLLGTALGLWLRRGKRAEADAELSDPNFF